MSQDISFEYIDDGRSSSSSKYPMDISMSPAESLEDTQVNDLEPIKPRTDQNDKLLDTEKILEEIVCFVFWNAHHSLYG